MDNATQQGAGLLRQVSTEAETLLWSHLRDRRMLGYKFRRQHQFPPYIADFYCAEKNLIVELDGSQHLDQQEYKNERTHFLNAQGKTVLRFWNSEVFNNFDDVVGEIGAALVISRSVL